MTFKVGDKVQCIDPGFNTRITKGKTYEVLDVDQKFVYISDAQGLGAVPYYLHRFELVYEPQEISYEDIKVGDAVRAELVTHMDTGMDFKRVTTDVREGEVHEITEYVLKTKHERFLGDSRYTYELLNRPEPKVTVPTELMSVIRHKERPDKVLVRVDSHSVLPWLGYTGGDQGWWYYDAEVQELLATGKWEVVTNEDH